MVKRIETKKFIGKIEIRKLKKNHDDAAKITFGRMLVEENTK